MSEKRIRNDGKAPTAAQLRDAIDRGAAADKVDFPDPAISPLGTDAEAGGASPTPVEIDIAFREEVSGKAEQAPQNRTLLAAAGFLAIIVIAAIVSLRVMPGL